jgi:hypothetical protein
MAGEKTPIIKAGGKIVILTSGRVKVTSTDKKVVIMEGGA